MKYTGSVTLVGAGCGRGLITVKGLEALRKADAVFYDDLADRSLLLELGPDCETVYVGKRAGRSSISQEEIHALLIAKAREGKRVVRLKGGDSFVFGRGKEELLALEEAGVPCAVIPGVTSAVAVPERFGIPVSHRGMAQSFTAVTGHSAGDAGENYAALAALSGTLVFLMPLGRIGHITASLMENGKDPGTPAALLSRAYSPEEKRIDGTLGDIAERAKEAETPAVLVVGPVAGFERPKNGSLPLAGVSAALTGTAEFTAKLEETLAEAGAAVEVWPILKTEPFEPLPDDLGADDWAVFTSSVGVRTFFEQYPKDRRTLAGLKFACVGPGTAAALRQYGYFADLIPASHTGADLGKALAKVCTAEDRVLLLRAEGGSDALPDALAAAGIPFRDVRLYRTKTVPMEIETHADYIVFASAGGVRAFYENGGTFHAARPVCIGEPTRQELAKHTASTPIAAETHTAEGILEAIQNDILKKETP